MKSYSPWWFTFGFSRLMQSVDLYFVKSIVKKITVRVYFNPHLRDNPDLYANKSVIIIGFRRKTFCASYCYIHTENFSDTSIGISYTVFDIFYIKQQIISVCIVHMIWTIFYALKWVFTFDFFDLAILTRLKLAQLEHDIHKKLIIIKQVGSGVNYIYLKM